MEYFGYLACFGVGVTLGLIGGGGSILAIPILVYLFSMDVVDATAYSLFMVGVTSLFGVFQRRKDASIDIHTGLIFGLPALIAAFATRKWFIPAIPDVIIEGDAFLLTKRLLMLAVFAMFIIAASFYMIGRRADYPSKSQYNNWLTLALYGGLVGCITGLVGVGGGFLIIPALLFLTRTSIEKAVGTALFIIAIKSLVGFTGDVLNYHINWPFLLGISIISIGGIVLGNRFSMEISGQLLRKSFGWFTLTVGIAILMIEL